MKQEITSEKKKELELEFKKSMLNVKIFSLMKKQLFSLVMMLALIVIASTSAWAQNTSAAPQILITGSSQRYTVTPAGTNTLTWRVAVTSTDANAAATDIASATASGNNFDVTWAESAAGAYYIEATERRVNTTLGEDCAFTVRRFYVVVYDFDVRVYASDVSGGELLTAALLAECGNGITANYGNEAGAGGGAAFNNNGGFAGDLATFVGVNGGTGSNSVAGTPTTRYVSFLLTWNGNVVAAPTIGSIVFNFDVESSSGDILRLKTVNAVTPNATGDGVTTLEGAGTIVNAAAPFSVRYTFPVVWNDIWGKDIVSTLNATGITLHTAAAGGGLIIGVEPSSKLGNNTSAPETILGSPATTTITYTPQ